VTNTTPGPSGPRGLEHLPPLDLGEQPEHAARAEPGEQRRLDRRAAERGVRRVGHLPHALGGPVGEGGGDLLLDHGAADAERAVAGAPERGAHAGGPRPRQRAEAA
jgi:hypothetical protein